MIELFKILEGITPNYLSDLFVKADNPYDTRDRHKLIQPLKRTTTYGLRSFQYYGAHVWNMLPINIKAAHSLHEFKSLIRSWPGPTCSCHICIALLWLMLLLCIAHCGGGLSVWRVCGRLWHRYNNPWCRGVVIVTAPLFNVHTQTNIYMCICIYKYICMYIYIYMPRLWR